MAIQINQAQPTVSDVDKTAHWITTHNGEKTDHGEYPYITITAPNEVCETVYRRLNDYHEQFYAARTSLSTTTFGVFVARGVDAEQFRSLVQAHVFVAYTSTYTEADLRRLSSTTNMVEELAKLFSEPPIKLEQIAEMVQGIVLILLRTMLKKRAEAVYSTHHYQMGDVSMGVVDGKYDEAQQALVRLKFVESAHIDIADTIRQVEKLISEMDVDVAALAALSVQIAPLKKRAKEISSSAEELANIASASEDAEQMLRALDTISKMIDAEKDLVTQSKELSDRSDQPWNALLLKLRQIEGLVPTADMVRAK